MHDNIRLKGQRFELSLGPKQVVALLIAVLVVLGSAFALGLGVGRRTGASAAQPPTAPSDALAALDEARAARVDPPPESKAQQAPNDSRSNDETDKTMPLPTVKSVNAPGAPAPHADGKTSPEPEMAAPPAIVTSPAPAVPLIKAGKIRALAFTGAKRVCAPGELRVYAAQRAAYSGTRSGGGEAFRLVLTAQQSDGWAPGWAGLTPHCLVVPSGTGHASVPIHPLTS